MQLKHPELNEIQAYSCRAWLDKSENLNGKFLICYQTLNFAIIE